MRTPINIGGNLSRSSRLGGRLSSDAPFSSTGYNLSREGAKFKSIQEQSGAISGNGALWAAFFSMNPYITNIAPAQVGVFSGSGCVVMSG
jgi:hypothetical protein